MTALLTAAIVLAPASYKYVTIDDFTETPWTHTLFFGQSIAHDWQGLDKRHCLWGERHTYTTIVSNPNQTSLTVSLGDHELKHTSPLPIKWRHYLEYGNDYTAVIDLSRADLFYLDFYTDPPGTGPDGLTLSVVDVNNMGGSVSWHGRVGGFYFRKSEFPGGIDWSKLRNMIMSQDFSTFPNPTVFSMTSYYARVKPGAVPPASQVVPTAVRKG